MKNVIKLFIKASLIFFLSNSCAYAACSVARDYQENEKLLVYLQSSCNNLLAVSDKPAMMVKVIATDKIKYPNAFATRDKGENIIIFTKPMLDELRVSPRALPFVVGHELSHLLSGHLAMTKKDEFVDAIISAAKSSFGSLFSIGGHSVVDLSIKSMETSNSQHKEFEADSKSKKMMIRAGYSDADAIYAIDLLIAASKTESWERFFSTHPDPIARRKHLLNDK